MAVATASLILLVVGCHTATESRTTDGIVIHTWAAGITGST